MSPHAPLRLGTLLTTVLAAVTLSGCGSTDASGPSVASLPPLPAAGPAASGSELEAPTDADAAFALFGSCLEGQGVQAPDLGVLAGGIAVDGDGADPVELSEAELEDWEAAASACEGHLANVQDGFELDADQQARMADTEAAFTDCMIDQGVDPEVLAIPAEDAGVGSGTSQEPSLDDIDAETFEQAVTACSDVLAGVHDTAEDGSPR